MPSYKQFLQELDVKWKGSPEDKLLLRFLGSAALMLQTKYERGTNDGDVIETGQFTKDISDRLVNLAGRGSALYKKHRIHIHIVRAGIPFLPHTPLWHPMPQLSAMLRRFKIEVLDVVDVVVSKLKRLSSNDISDIEAMVNLGLIPLDLLIKRFKDAVDVFSMNARMDDLPQYVRNLHRVERDILATEETPIELPNWI